MFPIYAAAARIAIESHTRSALPGAPVIPVRAPKPGDEPGSRWKVVPTRGVRSS